MVPRHGKVKKDVQKYVLPYLVYMAKIKPDISQQVQVLDYDLKCLRKRHRKNAINKNAIVKNAILI